MKITKRILAVILALTLTIGGISAAAQAAQTNRLFTANVFILVDNAWVAQDRAEAINGAEARALQTLFDRFFSNDLVGVHIAQSTNRVAIRPLEGVNLSAVLYNAQANTFRTMVLNRVCANGFWIFDIPQGAELPYSIVVSNGALTLRTASLSLPTQATTTRTTDRGGRDNDRDSGSSGNNWTPPPFIPTPPPGGGNQQPPTPPAFIAVTSITGVPTAGTVGTPLTLAGTVVPANATNQTITWSISPLDAGTTGANITSGNILNTTTAGTATLRATITNGATATTNFTQNFTITVTPPPFVAVTGITLTSPTTAQGGTAHALTATVQPSNATNQTITWSIEGHSYMITNAPVITSGNILNLPLAAGTVTVRATVVNGETATTNFTQDFTITVIDANLQAVIDALTVSNATTASDIEAALTAVFNSSLVVSISWAVPFSLTPATTTTTGTITGTIWVTTPQASNIHVLNITIPMIP